MTSFRFAAAFATEEHAAFTWQGTRDCAILMIHGFPGTPGEMRPLGTIVHDAGYTVHAPLLPGFGAELDTLAQKTADDWWLAVQRSYTQLTSTHRQVVVLGMSLGAALAIRLAGVYPCTALIALAPFWTIRHPLWSGLPVIKRVLPSFKPFRLFKPDFADGNVRASIKRFLPDANLDDPQTRGEILDFAVPVAMFDQIRTTGLAGYNAAAHVTCPTLILQGLRDELVLPATTRSYLHHFSNQPQYTEISGAHDLVSPRCVGWHKVTEQTLTFIHQHTGNA